MLRRLAFALCLAGGFLPRNSAAQALPVTVFVVRHAEKGPEVPDPSLSEAGQHRAAELARALTDARITALYTTEFKRTQETLAPLAAAKSLTPTRLLARDVDGLVAAIQALPAGSQAVVATHSNLIHLLVARLTGVVIPELTDLDYDRLVVVSVSGKGKGSAVVLRYGER